MSKSFIPYPTGIARSIAHLPVNLYRLGLGPLLRCIPIMVLVTRGRKTGLPRSVALEYRRHGSKFYVISAWGDTTQWSRNLQANPHATVCIGGMAHRVRAARVNDISEATRALNLFRRTSPQYYDPVLARLSRAERVNLHTLPEIAANITLIRLDIIEGPLLVPPVPVDRMWVWPVALMVGAVLSLLIGLGARQRTRKKTQDAA